jgi:PilZ domain-containing protein
MTEIENRRLNYRLARKPEHPWQLSIDDTLITKNIVDISATGISFKAPSSFTMEPGQTLNLSISLKPGEHFDCQGRVLWRRADAPASHTMNLFGVQFDKLPAWVDAMIVQELYKEALKVRWARPTLLEAPVISLPSKKEITPDWNHILRQVLAVALIASFFFAARLYEKSHPQDSVEYKFNQGLAKKLDHF